MSAAQRPLRVLAVADARSIHTLRWARRLADRGHDVHVVSNRVGADPRETEGITIHDLLALEPLMRNPASAAAMGARGRARVLEKFSLDAEANGIAEVYRRCAG